jgi:hypothetical protein
MERHALYCWPCRRDMRRFGDLHVHVRRRAVGRGVRKLAPRSLRRFDEYTAGLGYRQLRDDRSSERADLRSALSRTIAMISSSSMKRSYSFASLELS